MEISLQQKKGFEIGLLDYEKYSKGAMIQQFKDT